MTLSPVRAQEILVTEFGDTIVALTKSEVSTINQAFVDLEYTKKELESCDSILYHQKNIIIYQDSINSSKDVQIDILKKEVKDEKKRRIKSGFLGGGIGAIIGLIIGLIL